MMKGNFHKLKAKIIMKTKFIALICCLMACIMCLASCGGAAGNDVTEAGSEAQNTSTASTETESAATETTVTVKSVSKYGNVVINLTPAEFNALGIEAGDTVTVTVGNVKAIIPVGTSFSDVDSGNMIIRIDTEDNEVAVAINMGDFATTAGIGTKTKITEDPGYKWDINITELTVALNEKGGYLAEYTLRQLTRTNERTDYATLSDEEFANFRAVSTTGIRAGVLYRSSSPLDPDLGRTEYVMAAMQKAGVKYVLNLTDSETEMKAYAAYSSSYYNSQKIMNALMGYDFTSAEFAGKVRDCVTVIINNDGPFLIHCKEGKDRTGILCAIIECLMGASYDEIRADYMLTYKNFYGLEASDEKAEIIFSSNLEKTLCTLFGTDNLKTADLQSEAKDFMIGTGLTENDITKLKAKLG